MADQYFCKQRQRRQAVREHPVLNGIDYLEVLDADALAAGSPRQRTLLLFCIKPAPPGLTRENVEIHGGVRVTPVSVEWVINAADAADAFSAGYISAGLRDYLLELDLDQPNPGHVLVVRTDSSGDFSSYTLCLVTDDAPLTGFDPLLTEVVFSFKVECPSEFDCKQSPVCPEPVDPVPPIDYLAKDYASFRRLLLDRLSVVMPDWKERLAADIGVTLVEVMAYAGDRLSYYQDAAGSEAYLGTARRRSSIRRHARLLDYAMHDGCNARAWLCLEMEEGAANALLLREYAAGRRTRFFSRLSAQGTVIAEEEYPALVAEQRPLVFEPMFDQRLFAVHNRLQFYTWGEQQCCLPSGATRATLRDDPANRLLLRVGDVLVLEEVLGPATALAADADPLHRHAVRLTWVAPEAVVDEQGERSAGPLVEDELYAQAVVEIEWSSEDALPFPLCLSVVVEEEGVETYYPDVSLARGNVALVDYGRTITGELLPEATGDRHFRPTLAHSDITQRVALTAGAWAIDAERWVSAAAATQQDPRQALPAVELLDPDDDVWRPERDLLGSDRFDPDFVVEVAENGGATLRFGDNLFGRRPEQGVAFAASYRIGTGNRGNVGAEAIAHVLSAPGFGITGVRNPLAAVGGAAPESLEEVRQYAPQAFRRQERAVTEADYAEVAQRHPQVQRAMVRRRWTGSWHTMFVTVDRAGGLPVDQAFEHELSSFLQRYQLAGHDVEIEPPSMVSLDIAMTVCVKPNYLRSDVKLQLLQRFSRFELADGSLGYFHPDNYTFGQSVYLSRIVAAAMEVPGVRWVKVDPEANPPGRFQRWGKKANSEIEDGYLPIGRFEIARLDNDANAPESGRIEFHMEGGV